MITAKELREKFEKDLKELQDNCLHEEKKWLPYMWAPGHFAGEVLTCLKCEKILKKKT